MCEAAKGGDNVTPPGRTSYTPILIPTTPGNSNTNNNDDNTLLHASSSGGKNVKFGSASAAEFDSERPALEITPMPKAAAEKRYKLEERNMNETEEMMNEETKRNNAMLGDWEKDFDSYLDDEEDNEHSLETESIGFDAEEM